MPTRSLPNDPEVSIIAATSGLMLHRTHSGSSGREVQPLHSYSTRSRVTKAKAAIPTVGQCHMLHHERTSSRPVTGMALIGNGLVELVAFSLVRHERKGSALHSLCLQ